MNTCRFGPSICIILMSFWGSCIFLYIHSCIWKAVILWLRMSTAHTSVFCRSLMLFICLLCSSLNFCTTLNNTTNFTFCRFTNTSCSCSTHNHSALRIKADWTANPAIMRPKIYALDRTTTAIGPLGLLTTCSKDSLSNAFKRVAKLRAVFLCNDKSCSLSLLPCHDTYYVIIMVVMYVWTVSTLCVALYTYFVFAKQFTSLACTLWSWIFLKALWIILLLTRCQITLGNESYTVDKLCASMRPTVK
jgi:hypothetical protein